MHRNLQVSKQTQDKVKLAKQFIQSRYKQILYREEQQRVGWQKIMKALAQAPITDSQKKTVAEKALIRQSSNIRLLRVKQRLEDFQLLQLIGRGAFGQVRLARCKGTGQVVAIKRMAKSKLAGKKQVASVFLERQCLSRNKSRWLVQLKSAFQDKNYLYIAMQWVPGGDLLRLLIEKDIFSQAETRFYIGQLIVAIEQMHKMHYIHRDIKPDNILINAEGHLKLTDFGLSKELQPYKNKKQISVKQLGRQPRPSLKKYQHRKKRQFSKVGTPDYIAPEVLTQTTYDHRVDIWSIGVIMFQCLFGYPPFSHEDSRQVCQKVINWQQNLSFPETPKVSLEAKLLILGMLSPKEHRLNIAQIKVHPFFNNFNWQKISESNPPFRPDLKHDLDIKNFDTFQQQTPWIIPSQGQGQRQSHMRRSSSVGYQYNFAGFDWQPQPKINPFQQTIKELQSLQVKKSSSSANLKRMKTEQSQNTSILKSRQNLKFRNSVKLNYDKPKRQDRNPLLKKVGLKSKHLKTQN